MPQVVLTDEDIATLQKALRAYEELDAAQGDDALWSVESHADLQRICDEFVALLRPYLTAAR